MWFHQIHQQQIVDHLQQPNQPGLRKYNFKKCQTYIWPYQLANK